MILKLFEKICFVLAADFIGNGRVRNDRRCGPEFPLADNSGPSECDPNSANFCCSKWGFCGPDADHCDCPECVNYKLLAPVAVGIN